MAGAAAAAVRCRSGRPAVARIADLRRDQCRGERGGRAGPPTRQLLRPQQSLDRQRRVGDRRAVDHPRASLDHTHRADDPGAALPRTALTPRSPLPLLHLALVQTVPGCCCACIRVQVHHKNKRALCSVLTVATPPLPECRRIGPGGLGTARDSTTRLATGQRSRALTPASGWAHLDQSGAAAYTEPTMTPH